MARRYWRSGRPVKDVLAEEPYRFDPFQAARLLEALRPDAHRLASSRDPQQEAMRFVGAADLGFPASAIQRIRQTSETTPPEVAVTFMDFVGQNGPLPHAYTELVRDRLARRDPTMKAFLDLFLHRLVSVFMRARRRYFPGLDNRPPDDGQLTGFLLSLIGLGGSAFSRRLAVPDRLLLRYAALFAQRPRSAVGLKQILSDMIGTSVRVGLLQGDWLPIARSDQTLLGNAWGWGGQNDRLGRGMVLGTHAWSQSEGIELTAGSLTLPQFLSLLPHGSCHRPVASVIRFYLEQDRVVTLRLILQRAEIPRLILSRGPSPTSPRLGHTSWLITRAPRTDDAQVVLRMPTVDELAQGDSGTVTTPARGTV